MRGRAIQSALVLLGLLIMSGCGGMKAGNEEKNVQTETTAGTS